jgi:AcrR family transcriptional regulator
VESSVRSRPRRTQAERTAETRARLLDAALECIAERGYDGTTGAEIARRAGLSRGAQLNHFPTKGELMVVALEHLYARRNAEFRTAISELPPGPDRLERAIDMLWSFIEEPAFVVWLELTLAARTDPQLRARMIELEQGFHEITDRTWRDLFPGDESNPIYRIAPSFAWSLLDGLGLSRVSGSRNDEHITEILTAFKALARLMLGDVAGGSGS